jgi:sulfite reductase alpha subunit-like flavoprotein
MRGPPTWRELAEEEKKIRRSFFAVRLTMTSTATSVLWATQSGRAKACARRTLRLLQQQQQQKSASCDSATCGIQDCCAFDDIDFLSLGRGASSLDNDTNQQQQHPQHPEQQRLLILFVSTTGDAELPSNIQSTWARLLSKSTFPPSASSSSTYFSNVKFALFALGDRSYGPDAFCAAGRKLAARLVQLGATPICKLGYGDDGSLNGGVFADLDIWLEEELFPVLKSSEMPKNNVQLNTTTLSGGDEENGDEMEGEEYETKQKIKQQYLKDKNNTGQEDCWHLPYRVEVVKKQITTLEIADGADNPSVEKQVEWQRPEFEQYYSDYFMQSRPASSYLYTNKFVRISPTQQYQSQQPDIIQHKSCDAPLLGRVVINDRITSNDWIQDTRHIRIHVLGLAATTMRKNYVSTQSTTSEENNHSSDKNELNLPYLAGDVATILPQNPSQLVCQFLLVLPPSIRQLADDTLHISYNSNRLGSTTSTMNNHLWPQVCTLRGLLTHCVDIQSMPEREDLFALSSYCNLNHEYGMDQRTKLIALSEPAGASLYGDYIVREKRNWFDVFYDFDSLRCTATTTSTTITTTKDEKKETYDKGEEQFVHMTIDHLLALLPSIAPRHFSITSSPSYLNHELKRQLSPSISERISRDKVQEGFDLELCVAVVEGTTPLGRPYTGCCSKYLSSIVPNNNNSLEARTAIVDASSSNAITKGSDIVCMWIYPGSFSKLPILHSQDDTSSSIGKGRHRYFDTPVMCIGAGTGIAPLRSLIFEREYQIRHLISNSDTSNEYVNCVANKASSDDLDNILVFGCRKQTCDYYYGHEWTTLVDDKRLRLISAFSRDQVRGKLYVQRALRESDGGNLIVTHLLDRQGAVYIAGGSKMARAVKDEIVVALGAQLDGGEKEAKKYLNKLKRLGLFSIEAWS